jgi:Co/Zn/Cd efflux system component
LVTPAAYAAFVLTWIPMRARRDGEWRAVGALLADAFSGGRPSINDLVTFAAIWLLPRAFVQRAAFGYARLHGLLARRGRV